MGEVTRQVMKKDPKFFPIEPLDYGRYLVISLGTGKEKIIPPRFNAKMAAKWGVLGWLASKGAPLIEAFTEASADLVGFHNNVVFEALHSLNCYIRIQVCLMVVHILMYVTGHVLRKTQILKKVSL
ncbi:putative Acyl transferase/acyl hydrolase/lysophospholipase [Helianthus annuus]|nr:putative Acyl transferase/acyl hydrolase/lysophospholipase [Helianthus annuus]KAJ0535315.1 putative Acyl transferase/acyl hydrolase/lysophospholipase [Helianthus annuus]KAJ0543180.1 putative Acyl transferase/acyl hydrolase/lysophospholipase [Helianthus annuus]KAJ0708231.1 putative Acyl transferase/acyl hydrolase/lysophospholipase [Helianthus annuus]KAJ0712189.1 putative Acyl transferase/acyl hydrolase/lysophospholipase [Helianthus annuus]